MKNLVLAQKKSSFLSLNLNDFWKGLIIVVISAILGAVYGIVESNGLNISWALFKPAMITGLLAGISYMLKNLVSNNAGKIMKTDE